MESSSRIISPLVFTEEDTYSQSDKGVGGQNGLPEYWFHRRRRFYFQSLYLKVSGSG